MKPNFALSLSFDGIRLLQRAFRGWKLVGEVALDADDLSGALRALRKQADALDPGELRAKLILPDEQLKYLSIDISDDPDAAVRAALDGATPYAVDDLAYDWVSDESGIQVAAVALETLAEAEAFAVEHGFNPVSFVAQPKNAEFGGEPFFGATQHALAQGIPVEQIDRDPVPVRVIGTATTSEPVAPSTVPEPDRPHMAEATANEAEDLPAPAVPDSDPQKPEAEQAAPEQAAPEQAMPETAPPPVAAFSSIRASRDGSGAATPAKLDGVTRDRSALRVTLTPTQEDRAAGSVPPVPDPAEPGQAGSEVTSDTIRPAGGHLPDAPPPRAEAEPVPDRATDFESAYAAAEPDSPAEAGPAPDRAMSFFSRRQRQAAPALAAAGGAVPPSQSERQRMTVFGAREKTEIRGKPRFLGLILTAILLIFLIGVAAWASIFLDDGLARFFREDRDPVVADLAAPDAPEPRAAEAGAETEPPVELVSLQPPDEPLPVLEDPATEILSRVSPRDLSPDEAMARYAATGIWQLAPGPPADLAAREMEDFYQTTLDPDPDFGDAVALPDAHAALGDLALPSPALPPAADATFTFDARGLVLATPEGALTPAGVRVFAGLPEVSLPAALRPGADRPEPEPEASPDTARLALLRPRPRPEDAAEQIERSGLSGRTLSELATLRPRLRPESAQEAADAANARATEEAATAASASTVDLDALQGALDQAVAQPDPFVGATSQAVSASLKPNTRPSNFAAIVKQAEEKAVEQPVRVAAAQRVSPNIPSTASVAKAATDRNALKFERVNLIGVYGTTSNRRALVRTSNGRYHKVKVGDRLDGGRVSAIGDGELRYQKGGRNIILQMPRG